ncbi:MAG: hypothetical protein AMXMBFR84_29860 [Candidatus Hydrogenedentota bacterium]
MLTKPPKLPVGEKTWKYLSPADLRKFKNLLFAARIIVEGAFSGRHKSPYKGSASEFIDYRQYFPGDEMRTIDWKAYARTDRFFIKLFQTETDMNTYLLVDRSASMAYGGPAFKNILPNPGVSKLEYACYLAAALTFCMVKQGDRVGMTVFDDRVSAHIPPGGTFGHLYKVLTLLEKLRPGRKTSISKALRDMFPMFKRRGLLIVISDFIDDPAEVFRALNMYRHRRFEVILFHVLHAHEFELPPLDSIHFVDAEDGQSITASPKEIQAAYAAEMKSFVDTMRSMARARNMEYNFLNTETPYHAAMQKYLMYRSAV